MKHYSHRIRILDEHLSERLDYVGSLDSRILQAVWQTNPRKETLLVNLYRLHTSTRAFQGTATFARLTVGPKLRQVCIARGIWTTEAAWQNTEMILRPYARMLSSFIIYEDDLSRDVRFTRNQESPNICRLISGLRNVTDLGIRTTRLSCSEFYHIAQLPMLKNLSINVDVEPQEITALMGMEHPGALFPNLHSLTLETHSYEDCIHLLGINGFRNLKFLKWTRLIPRFQDFRVLFKVLHDHVPKIELESLEILHSFIPGRMLPETLQLLMGRQSLTRLTINPVNTSRLDDSALISLSRALPNLTHLRLCDYEEIAVQASATLACLPIIAMSCPQLEELCLRVNALQVPDLSKPNTVNPSKLHTLDVCSSLISHGDIGDVAEFLAVSLPTLRELEHSHMKNIFLEGTAYDINEVVRWDQWEQVKIRLFPFETK